MTDRLYYQDQYLTEFDAVVVERGRVGDAPAVVLDRTAFYPEGGGQPADQGTLNDVPVVDVQVIDGRIWHVLDVDLDAEHVRGIVDWERRWDHMQQHTGQHILSQAFLEVAGAATVSFHLGVEISTIDLDRTGIDEATLDRVEALANQIVLENRPVRASFVSHEELASLPLRRPPKVKENIRVVVVEGFDWSACGGTHVRATGEVGPIKIVKTERRGEETRVTFLCGKRALADYAHKHKLVQGLMSHLTCAEDEVKRAVERLEREARAARRALHEAEEALAAYEADALWSAASIISGVRVVSHVYVDHQPEWVRRLAQALRDRPGTVALLAWAGERPQMIFARSEDVDADVSDLLRVAAQVSGGRGGGRPDWAQGGGGHPERLGEALRAAEDALRARLVR
ncbi:MAG: alanyl-tRNA editing protein [Anaerolineae bacterium]|nr:alanyl-tRNA editing protein [Anaerolineae bacterium]